MAVLKYNGTANQQAGGVVGPARTVRPNTQQSPLQSAVNQSRTMSPSVNTAPAQNATPQAGIFGPGNQGGPLPPAGISNGLGNSGPPAQGPGGYVTPGSSATGGGGRATNRTTLDGVSAVNPQARGNAFRNVDRYIDQSFNNAMTRLQPGIDQSRDALSQSLIDRGIGVGSEAYTEAMQGNERNIADATQNAAFQAMGFGTGLQNQMFQQDATRSGLANNMLQAQMRDRLGWGQVNEGARQFNNRLNENMRQFDNSLNERGRQFDAGLWEGARQFDDNSARAWDNMGFGQMMGLEGLGFRDRQYADSRSDRQDALLMSMLGMPMGGFYTQDPTGAYASQMNFGANNYGNWLNGAGGMAGMFGGFLGGF